MKRTCLLALFLFVTIRAASISLHYKPFDIPVKVIYSDEDLKAPNQLADKSSELLDHSALNDNLDEKLQLSPNDVLQKDKHLPVSNSVESIINLKLEDEQAESVQPPQNQEPAAKPDFVSSVPNVDESQPSSKPSEGVSETPNAEVSPTESPKPSEEVSETVNVEVSPTEKPASSSTSSSTEAEEDLPDPNYVLLVQLAQTIVNNGLNVIKQNVNKYVEADTLQPPISNQQWAALNQTLTDFFTYLLQRETKRDYTFILVEVAYGVDNVTSSFINGLKHTSYSNLRQEPNDVLDYLRSEFKSMKTNIQNLAPGAAVRDSSPPVTISPSPVLQNQTVFQVFVSQLSQLLTNLNPFSQPSTEPSSSQVESSTPDAPSQSNAFETFQNAANQFSHAIASLNPFNPTTSAPVIQTLEVTQRPLNPLQNLQKAADQLSQVLESAKVSLEVATLSPPLERNASAPNPLENFQTAVNQFGQALLNLNPLIQRPAAPANSSADEVTTPNPLQTFQQAANQLGSALLNLNPFAQPPNPQAYSQDGGPENSQNNPLQGIQNAVSNFGQAVGSLNPFNSPPIAQEGEAPSSSPVEVTSESVNQVAQVDEIPSPVNELLAEPPVAVPAVNNLNSANQPNPAVHADNPTSTSSNPIQGAVNQVGQVVGGAINNFGQVVAGLNPFRPPQVQSDDETTPNPLQGIQNAVNQVGQAVSGLNPFNQVPTVTPQTDGTTPYNPVQGFQNALNTFGQAVGSFNPFRPQQNGQADEATSVNPFQGLQSAVNQVGQAVGGAVNNFGSAVGNLNPFRPPNPAGQADDPSSTANPIQGAVNQVGQAVSQLNPFNQPTAAPGAQGDEAVVNPFQGIQNAANQVGQAVGGAVNNFGAAVGNLNPFRPPNPEGQNDDPSSTVNPIQGAVNQVGQVVNSFGQAVGGAVNNFGSAVGNLNPFRPPNQTGQADDPSSTVNPVQGAVNQVGQGLQNAAINFGQAVNSINPFRPQAGTPPAAAPQAGAPQGDQTAVPPPSPAGNQVGVVVDNPTHPATTNGGSQQTNVTRAPSQNPANQISLALVNLNLFNNPNSQSAPPEQPIEQVIDAAADAVDDLNPFNRLVVSGPTNKQPIAEAIQEVEQ